MCKVNGDLSISRNKEGVARLYLKIFAAMFYAYVLSSSSVAVNFAFHSSIKPNPEI